MSTRFVYQFWNATYPGVIQSIECTKTVYIVVHFRIRLNGPSSWETIQGWTDKCGSKTDCTTRYYWAPRDWKNINLDSVS